MTRGLQETKKKGKKKPSSGGMSSLGSVPSGVGAQGRARILAVPTERKTESEMLTAECWCRAWLSLLAALNADKKTRPVRTFKISAAARSVTAAEKSLLFQCCGRQWFVLNVCSDSRAEAGLS